MMVYKIFAAYETNDDSILYEKDYSDQEVFEKYVGEITANKDISANIRDMQIGQGDKILTLSTCALCRAGSPAKRTGGTNDTTRLMIKYHWACA